MQSFYKALVLKEVFSHSDICQKDNTEGLKPHRFMERQLAGTGNWGAKSEGCYAGPGTYEQGRTSEALECQRQPGLQWT